MLVEETIFEENGIRAYVEREDYKPDPEAHKCHCGRSVCCGKHKGCCQHVKKIRFIDREGRQ